MDVLTKFDMSSSVSHPISPLDFLQPYTTCLLLLQKFQKPTLCGALVPTSQVPMTPRRVLLMARN